MLIRFIELQGFRKLQSVRIDFNDTTTLFVGANNSGKTSAMVALSHFLIDPRRFSTNDFTLSNWIEIDKIGTRWEEEAQREASPLGAGPSWAPYIPTLDLWLEVKPNEIHHVRPLLPTLDWTGGLLAVRLRYEPTDVDSLKKEYLAATAAAHNTRTAGAAKAGTDKEYTLTLWPSTMRSFLDRKLRSLFTVRVYLLDPTKGEKPSGGLAKPQPLPSDSEPIEGNPLSRLIRIDEIGAHRGLGDGANWRSDRDDQLSGGSGSRRRLSEQLKSYYSKHLDPSEFPEPEDLDALEAIESAQKAYDVRLSHGFADAITELESLNYPGITDPVLRIATRLRPVDGLDHGAAIQYEVISPADGTVTAALSLPEEYNGLGYQNLISMVFRLMSFRDAWMLVGKAAKVPTDPNTESLIPPLHLVLIEEPEAHLHVQVQQVFVRKAFDVLRNHPELKDKPHLTTQLLVSTHSSHVAHESRFSCLRYFRRLPARSPLHVPTSAVVNLSEVFGKDDETEKFAARYLKSTHCELFFADAAILVEGPAERMLVPHFILHKYPILHRSYVTLLEIGGSHAHRLRPLIECLGLTSLLITDIDSAEAEGRHKAACPKRGANLISRNVTLTQWHPEKKSFDELLALEEGAKVKVYSDPSFSVRVAYQTPMTVDLNGVRDEALATTFEDALVFENLSLFKTLTDSEEATAFSDAIEGAPSIAQLGEELFKVVSKCDKAAFALDVLWLSDPSTLKVPTYIEQGLDWLSDQLDRKRLEVLATTGGTGGPADTTADVLVEPVEAVPETAGQ